MTLKKTYKNITLIIPKKERCNTYMSKENYKGKNDKKQYHHLTRDQRAQIEILVNEKDENGIRIYSNADIAEKLGVHRSTIWRELKYRVKSKIIIRSGKIKNKPYNVKDAQYDADYKRAFSKAVYLVEQYPKLAEFIDEKIQKDKWAPDVIAGYIESHQLYLQEGFASISTTTIYRAIHYHLLKSTKDDTRRMNKFNTEKDCYQNRRPVSENKKGNSIELRPDNINNRERFGDWELDTVISTSKGQHQCLMTLTDRKVRFEIIAKLEGKTKDEVVNKMKKIKSFFNNNLNDVIKSISTDNGTEFSAWKEIQNILNTTIYFCHPYASFEKGTNEKHNGLIRYFIPKGNLIENYSNKDINDIANWMNNYPRKIFGYRTPIEMLREEIEDDNLFNKIICIQKELNAVQ